MDEGVVVENSHKRVVFDPHRRTHFYSEMFITHAHQDHSRGFSFRNSPLSPKFSTKATREIVKTYGRRRTPDRWRPIPIGLKVKIGNWEVVSHDAGHVLGSAQYEVITPEGTVVYTGDLQFRDSFTLKGAEPVHCDTLVIESTFGSEKFRFPERETVAHDMVQWASRVAKYGKIPTFKTDTLGNAQEIIRAFNLFSKLPVIVHHKIARINKIYNANGQNLTFLEANSEEATEVTSSDEWVLITPKGADLRKHPELVPALVSGWALWSRGNAFPLSDHADFDQLLEFVEACRPKVVLTCFGRFKEALAKQVEKSLGIKARPLARTSKKATQQQSLICQNVNVIQEDRG